MILSRPAPAGHVALLHPDEDHAQAMARVLRSAGYRVSLVTPHRHVAQTAIDLLPDLLIGPLALTEPPLGGVVHVVRQVLGPDLPVLVILADGDPRALVEADDIVREPVDPGELRLRVGSLLRAGYRSRVLERRLRDILGLYQVSWALLMAAGPPAVYGHLARHSAELLEADKAMLLLFDREARQLVGQYPAHGLTRGQVDEVRYDVDLARRRWNFRTQGALLSNQPRADARLVPGLAAALDLHALLLAPLAGVGTRAFHGLLLVADRAGGAGFDEDDLAFLNSLAGQVSVAVENLGLHRELRHKNALLAEYDRTQGELVAMVAHDFRKPLTAIRGFAELVLEEPDLPADARQEFMRTVVGETEHLAALADDTLLVTRIETGALEYSFAEFELGPFLLDCMPLGLSNHSLLLDVPDHFPPIVADRERLRQVIDNLTSNAVKYSPGGGSIIVRGRQRGPDHVQIEVIDHGLGIPEDQLGQLFRKFVRVRSEAHAGVPGTGLGLYIARLIVEGHGGRIWVESEPGRGSTFGLLLPLDARQATHGTGRRRRERTAVPLTC